MNFAVIDTVKWDDHGNDNHSSKNICIPMNKGMLLSVLNRTPITASTETIRVKVLAEEGFDPLREIDVPSLRFGSYNEVNFGRGCKVVKTEASEKDLILTFDGKGSGITPDEFAPKMIGKDKQRKTVVRICEPALCRLQAGSIVLPTSRLPGRPERSRTGNPELRTIGYQEK